MTPLGRTLLTLTVMASLTGCVGTRIEYFTDTTYPPRHSTSAVEWLPAEPARPHVEVARITVRSSNYSLETLRHTMQDRARSLGADAIVPDVPMVLISQAGSPYYEPGVLGPAGAAFGLYGYAGGIRPIAPTPTS